MSTKIKLNVGGFRYEVAKSTLMSDPESMLAKMIQQPNEIRKINSDQELFIDRDGKHFGYVLNYLRDGDQTVLGLKQNDPVCQLLSREADFYQLYGLINLIKRMADLKIGDNVQLNKEGFGYFDYINPDTGTYYFYQRICWICESEFKSTSRHANYTYREKPKHESFLGKIFEIKDRCATVRYRKHSLLNVYYTKCDNADDVMLKIHIPLTYLKLV